MKIKIDMHKNSRNVKVALERVNDWKIPETVKKDI